MTRSAALGLLFSVATCTSAVAATEAWTVDPGHVAAQFTARHFGIVPVAGSIPVKKVVVKLDPDSQIPIEVSAELDPSNVDTHNGSRDKDLRSGNYFDVATFPSMTFQSTKITGTDPRHFTIVGNLTMHGQTHAVTLNAAVVGELKTPRGGAVIAYAAKGSLDRRLWGLGFGPIVVANGIDISLNVEAARP